MKIERTKGIAYAQANLVTEENGQLILTTHGVRYYDTYETVGDKWLIAERDQYFVFTKTEELAAE